MRNLFVHAFRCMFMVLVLCLWANPARAQVYVGYCDEAAPIQSSVSVSTAVATVSVAVVLTPELLSTYVNTAITELRFGLNQSSGLKSLTVWLRSELEGENLVSLDANVNTLKSGWNSLPLAEPLELLTDRTLYLGITYSQQRRNAQIIGTSGNQLSANAYLLNTGSGWSDQSGQYLPACLQLLVVRSTGHEFALTDVHITANRYQEVIDASAATHQELQPVMCVGEVTNLGAEHVSSFTVTAWAQAEGQERIAVFVGEVQQELAYLDKCRFSFSFVPSHFIGCRNIRLIVETAWADGSPDETPADNARELFYDVVPSTADLLQGKTTLLVEQFVSLKNGFSVLGQQNVQKAVSSYAASPEALPLCMLTHHHGYGPADSLRVSNGSDYSARTVFGPEGLSYAPALSVNRRHTMSSTFPADSLLSAIQAVANNGAPHTFITNVQVLPAGVAYMLECDVVSTSYSWCHNPVLMAALVQDEVMIQPGSQKDYGYTFEPSEPLETSETLERSVLVSYLTPSCDLSLIPGLDTDVSADIIGIECGYKPSPEPGTKHFSIPFALPASDSVHPHYHIVIWTCNMTSADRVVDNAAKIPLQ